MDLNEFATLTELEEVIVEFAPDFIGISIRNIDNTDTTNCRAFLEEYKTLVRQIRKKSTARIILGGSGFTIFPIEFMQALDADYGIVGEGERLPLLLQALEKKTDVRNLPGVVLKETTDIVYGPYECGIKRSFNPDSSHTKFYMA